MGYESKVYIVTKSGSGWLDGGKRYGNIVGTFDLCKMAHDSAYHALMNKSKPTDCCIYETDGNTKIVEDRYGAPLKEMSLPDLIEALQKDNDGYRRIPPLIAMVSAIVNDPGWGMDDVVALHFGY